MKILNNAIVKLVKILPQNVVYLFAKKYISGKTLDDAVRVTKELNSKGIYATIDVLGEAITDEAEATAAKDEVLRVLDVIEKNKLKANVSIKPTQFGLAIDVNLARKLIKEIILKAEDYGNFVRIDMEDSPFTQKTIDLFKDMKKEHSNVGIVLQAYLRRTVDDVKDLNAIGTNYRICKGIYVEPEEIAYKGKQEVRDNYLRALELMLDNGNYVGIATHDKYLIEKAYEMIKNKNIAKDKFEFQMLYGVTEHLRDKINADGYKIRIYVPYGQHWYPYSVRRLQENPQVAWYITKSIFKLG